ncbi:hypothetical protein [Alkaliphilus transvaalensis]|uniref:hypothetical protein n=1 Tax=Alkaliphilus transvaalensis TaxID=114628 RepID=UPI0004797BB3|nr:hypothetical protein [Alkaliphilus transvaalensis]
MQIAILDGTPKFKESRSGYLINHMENLLGGNNECHQLKLIRKSQWQQYYKTIDESEVILLVAPLYVDGLPSHVLDFMYHYEKYLKDEGKTPNLVMYTIINCGFYEGIQNKIAIEIVNNWCNKIGITKGGGIGIGAGTLLATDKPIPFTAASRKTLKEELQKFKELIEVKGTKDDLYLNPQMSRSKCMRLSDMYWYFCGFANRLTPKKLYVKRQ